MITWLEAGLRLLGAMALGALIGWERETQGKPAGLRTHMLVALAASLYVVAAEAAASAAGEPMDAVRAMAGVAQGVAFLGAGIILQTRGEVRWLTTAASVWASAAVGLSIGLGQYAIAGMAAVLIYITLRWLDRIETHMRRRQRERHRAAKESAQNAAAQTPEGPAASTRLVDAQAADAQAAKARAEDADISPPPEAPPPG